MAHSVAPCTAPYRGHDGALLPPGRPELLRVLTSGFVWLWGFLLVSTWPRLPWPEDLRSALAWLVVSYLGGLALDLCARFLIHQLLVRRLLVLPTWGPLSPALARHLDHSRAEPPDLADEEALHAVFLRVARVDPDQARLISSRRADGFLAADLCLVCAFNAAMCGFLGYWVALSVLIDFCVLFFLRSVVAAADVHRLTSIAAVTILPKTRRDAAD